MGTTDKLIDDIRGYAGLALEKDHTSGTAALILGLVGNLERSIRTEREEAFCRITALRLALRQIADLADASEPLSVVACRWATDALEVDGTVVSG